MPGNRRSSAASCRRIISPAIIAGLRKKERPSYPAAVAAVTQGDFGDSHFRSRTHHGTEEERANAVVRGFQRGLPREQEP